MPTSAANPPLPAANPPLPAAEPLLDVKGLVAGYGKIIVLHGVDLTVRAGEIVGALGVIGPTRMDYSRVIPLVELTAKAIGLALDPTDS